MRPKGAAGKGEQQRGEDIDFGRREALTRLAKYGRTGDAGLLMPASGAVAAAINLLNPTLA